MLKYDIIPVTPYQQNCSLVWCSETQQGAIIDPGGEAARLIQHIERSSVTLAYIWLTHGHFDHISGAREVASHFNIPIWGPTQQEQFLFDMLPEQTQQFGFPYVDAFLPDRWLVDGEELLLGSQKFQIVHCPGHTPGHIALINLSAKVAWVGDILFNGGIGRTDFPRGNYRDLIQSIQEKLLPLGDDIFFISGHGPTSTFGHEKQTNPFLLREHKGFSS